MNALYSSRTVSRRLPCRALWNLEAGLADLAVQGGQDPLPSMLQAAGTAAANVVRAGRHIGWDSPGQAAVEVRFAAKRLPSFVGCRSLGLLCHHTRRLAAQQLAPKHRSIRCRRCSVPGFSGIRR